MIPGMTEEGPDFLWEAQMGFTRRELLRGLPRAVEPYEIRDPAVNPVEISQGNRIVSLYTGAEGFRSIASMRIPVMPVRLEFRGFNEAEYESFLGRFRTYLQKGGG